MFFTGPFAGTGVSTCSRLVVGCKSPQTGTILDSYVGGSFGPELKFAGYDAIIVTGRAAEPTLVWIKDDVVELRSAAPYMGMKIGELESTLRARPRPAHAGSCPTAPRGRTCLPWACLSTDQAHKAGRGGAGALMGTKNVKAIAVRGHRVGRGRRRQGLPRRPLPHPQGLHLHAGQHVGSRRGHPGARRHGRRRRRDADPQLVAGPVRRHRPDQLGGLPEGAPEEARLQPVRDRLPQLPRHRRRPRRGSRVRDGGPLRRQLRRRRHRGPASASTSPATTSAWTRSRRGPSSASRPT